MDLLAMLPTYHGPIRISFQSLSVGDHYFRSVFISVLATPDLLALHREINTRLSEFSPSSPVFPHMSLSYIADEDAEERGRASRLLRDRGIVLDNEDQTISLQCDVVRLSHFDAMEIWVIDCGGMVESWNVQHKISLKA